MSERKPPISFNPPAQTAPGANQLMQILSLGVVGLTAYSDAGGNSDAEENSESASKTFDGQE